MIKVAVLDDYQNIFKEFIDIDKYKGKYEFTIFNEPFQNEAEAIVLLEKFDALMTPAVPFTAPPIKTLKAIINKKEYNYMDNIHRKFFGPFNITGMPSLVIPIGKDDYNLPIAIQIAGKKWCEHKILQIAYNIEKNIMYDKTIKF